jgi:protein-S-isoprenylcysteine O-methyltransferase Ste14
VKPIRGREAKPAGPRANLAKTLGQAAAVWALFFWLIPSALFAVETAMGGDALRFASPGWRVAGAVTFALAGALNLTSAYFMAVRGGGTPLPAACPRVLVAAGPYGFVRNPMAMSALVQGAAVGLYLGSPLVLLYAAAGALAWQTRLRPWEEADLELRFGEPYRRYRHAVRCWIPRLTAYRGPGGREEPPL